MRPKTSERLVWGNARRSDLMAGDNPWNGTREAKPPQGLQTRVKCATLWKGKMQIRRATSKPGSVRSQLLQIVRVRV